MSSDAASSAAEEAAKEAATAETEAKKGCEEAAKACAAVRAAAAIVAPTAATPTASAHPAVTPTTTTSIAADNEEGLTEIRAARRVAYEAAEVARTAAASASGRATKAANKAKKEKTDAETVVKAVSTALAAISKAAADAAKLAEEAEKEATAARAAAAGARKAAEESAEKAGSSMAEKVAADEAKKTADMADAAAADAGTAATIAADASKVASAAVEEATQKLSTLEEAKLAIATKAEQAVTLAEKAVKVAGRNRKIKRCVVGGRVNGFLNELVDTLESASRMPFSENEIPRENEVFKIHMWREELNPDGVICRLILSFCGMQQLSSSAVQQFPQLVFTDVEVPVLFPDDEEAELAFPEDPPSNVRTTSQQRRHYELSREMIKYWLEECDHGTSLPSSAVPKKSYMCSHIDNIKRFLAGSQLSSLYRGLERMAQVSFWSSGEVLDDFRSARRTSSRTLLYGKKYYVCGYQAHYLLHLMQYDLPSRVDSDKVVVALGGQSASGEGTDRQIASVLFFRYKTTHCGTFR